MSKRIRTLVFRLFAEFYARWAIVRVLQRLFVVVFPRRDVVADAVSVRPLSAVDSLTDISPYAGALDEALRHDDVLNVAVTGRYGAGKSSFLKTYFKEKHPIWISLAAFIAESRKPGELEAFERKLQYSVLQQMFYAARQSELPFSRFKRIVSVGIWRYFGAGLFVLLVAFSVLGAWQPDFVTVHLQKMGVSLERLFIASLIIGAMAIVCLTMLCYDLMRSSKGWKVCALTVEVEKNDPAGSVFNSFLDELIYYFSQLKCPYVVFEDIDRFEDVEIFVKLRELNQLLNHSRQISLLHRPIRFIYAVRDDTFTGTARTKFFDYILPIIPVVNASTSYYAFRKNLEPIVGGERIFDTEFKGLLKGSAPFISDMRTVYNICNEYAVYRKMMQASMNGAHLLAVIIFKNLFPREFDAAHAKHGLLPTLFSMKDDAVLSKVGDLKVKLSNIAKREQELRTVQNMKIDDLKRRFIADGLCQLLPDGMRNLRLNGSQTTVRYICSLNNFDELQEKAVTGEIYVSGYYQGNFEITFRKIQEKVGFEFASCAENILALGTGELARLADEREAIRREIERVKSLPFSVFAREGFINFAAFKRFGITDDSSPDVYDEDQISCLSQLCSGGWLNENYRHCISLFSSNGMAQGDFDFVMAVLKGIEPTDIDRKLNNPARVIEELDAYAFTQKSVLNVSLFRSLAYLYSSEKTRTEAIAEKMRNFVSVVVEYEESEKNEYLSLVASFLTSASRVSDLDVLTSAFSELRADYIERMIGWSRISDSNKIDLLGAALARMRSLKMKLALPESTETFLLDSMESGLVFERGGCSADEVLAFFVDRGMRLKQCNPEPYRRIGAWSILLEHECFQWTSSMTEEVLRSYASHSMDPAVGQLTRVKKTVPEKIWNFLLKSFSEYVSDCYSKLEHEQDEDPEVLLAILNNDALPMDARLQVVEKQRSFDAELGDVKDASLRKKVFAAGLVRGTWRTACTYYEDAGLDDCLVDFLMRRHDTISASELMADDLMLSVLKPLVNDIAVNASLSDDVVFSLIRGLEFKHPLVNAGSLAPRRFETLFVMGAIEVSPEFYLALKEAGLGVHLLLAEKLPKWFIEHCQPDWLDEADVKSLLEKDLTDRERRKIVLLLLRPATTLILGDAELRQLFAANIRYSEVSTKECVFTREQCLGCFDEICKTNVQVGIIFRFIDDADEVWSYLGRCYGAKGSSEGIRIEMRLPPYVAKLAKVKLSRYGMVVLILPPIGEHNLVVIWRNAEAVATSGTPVDSGQSDVPMTELTEQLANL